MIKSLTPVLPVNRIEPSLAFFERVGFEKLDEVPEGDHLGFVILANGEIQLMYQTRTSIKGDHDVLPNETDGTPALIYITVTDLDAIAEALEGFNLIMPERTTFYGAREIGYREPGGHVVTFAQFAERADG
ncbi:VOC family protein [Kordiimonas sp.]|uniref:VOC family protein n=1 Tax=Kordiimonas sp. TaxID=1970157 RepID=UPI003A90F24E